MREWQPIETAPKDGTECLVFGLWAGEINGPDYQPGRYVAAWVGPFTDYPGFEWSCAGTDAYSAWVKPTHWMPLAPAPEAHGPPLDA